MGGIQLRRHKRQTAIPVLAAVALLCSGAATFAGPGGTAPKFGSWGFDLSAMDKSVKPGDDFFTFANGAWYKTAVIPPDRSSTGTTVNIEIKTEDRLKAIVGVLAAKPYASLNADEKKLRDLYDAYVDQKAIDAAGLAPAKKNLDFIAGLKTLDDVAAAMGRPGLGLQSPLAIDIETDAKDSNRYVVTAGQSGLPMDRDYYLKDDKALATVREAYKKHLAQMFTLAGIADGEKRAAAVYDVEHKLAQAQWSNVENRDVIKTYNSMSFIQLKALAPQFPWDSYFKAAGIPVSGPRGERQVIVKQLSAFPKIAQIFAATPVAVWRDYLTVHYLDGRADCLPKTFDDAMFAFFGTVLSGSTQQLPRETRALYLLNGQMGFALGKLYVDKYFPPEAQAKIVALVNNLIKAYDADIRTLTWMTPATRDKALDKLHRMSVQVGYPAHWRDYSRLVIKGGDLLADVEASSAFDWQRQLARLDKPVDRTEWEDMPPQTADAENDPNKNMIVFPAAFLQPPFFDPNADAAVNYGAIGAVIGHEISHSFDDQGSQYGPDGSLENWWTPADRQAFEAQSKILVAQYNAFEPLPGLRVNGALTLGENIADNAGAAIALKAYHLSLGGKPAPVLDGYTGDQRFYLALAQNFRTKVRDDALRQNILTDVHTPAKYRAIGITRNQDAWYTAFGVKPGDKYYLPPDQRIHMW
ncbi:MAG: M13 family metallopeptidase [Xanthobacteraceae bacterium]